MANQGAILIGGEAIENVIDQLPKQSSKRRVWRRIARKGSRPIINDIRGQIPKTDSTLKKSIVYKNYKPHQFRGQGGFIKAGKKPTHDSFSNPARDSVWINNRKVKQYTRTYPNWYLRASNRQGNAVLSRMEKDAVSMIDAEIKKLLKKK